MVFLPRHPMEVLVGLLLNEEKKQDFRVKQGAAGTACPSHAHPPLPSFPLHLLIIRHWGTYQLSGHE